MWSLICFCVDTDLSLDALGQKTSRFICIHIYTYTHARIHTHYLTTLSHTHAYTHTHNTLLTHSYTHTACKNTHSPPFYLSRKHTYTHTHIHPPPAILVAMHTYIHITSLAMTHIHNTHTTSFAMTHIHTHAHTLTASLAVTFSLTSFISEACLLIDNWALLSKGWVSEWMSVWVSERVSRCVNEWVSGWKSKRVSRCVNEWVSGANRQVLGLNCCECQHHNRCQCQYRLLCWHTCQWVLFTSCKGDRYWWWFCESRSLVHTVNIWTNLDAIFHLHFIR